jgi:hypothetical protein
MYGDRRQGNTTAILIGAAMISVAILLAPRGGGPEPPVPLKAVRQQVIDQLHEPLQGKRPVQGAERELKRIVCADVRYSRSFDRIRVEFDLIYEPALTLRGACVLHDDGFGRYQGDWSTGMGKIPLSVAR